MDSWTPGELQTHFATVDVTIGEGLSKGNPHVLALVAKWKKADPVPGLSDMDFRVICDNDTTVDDWVQIDRLAGLIHLEVVQRHPEWNRINEHTAGAGMTVSEVMDPRFHNPEYMVWSLWWGKGDWLDRLKAEMAARDFDTADEHYHLSKFLHYYSPYIHGVDPPINLGLFEPKYALHSRCWHYFAPPILSAASLLAQKHFPGKREGLAWLRDNGYAARQVDAVLEQVDAHYDTPELIAPARLQAFEDLLFAGFEQLFPALLESIEDLEINRSAEPAEVKKQLALIPTDPLEMLMESVRFARIRAGRYFFYVNSPEHFDADRLILCDLPWIRKLSEPIFASLRTLLGDQTLSPGQCFGHLGLKIEETERRALDHILDLGRRSLDDAAVPGLFGQAIDLFPYYYRLLEEALSRVLARVATAEPAFGRPLARVV